MTHEILFIQGGGSGALKEDEKLVANLKTLSAMRTKSTIQRCRTRASPTIRIGKRELKKSWSGWKIV
jgi:hypothetical protein